ncbi:hypothetical protein [Chromobacterium amazonense]|uniref:hypothetical protein n=1 Tax=Chromobacterium amazonense TaxID=1382803 RepID=UPI003F78B860
MIEHKHSEIRLIGKTDTAIVAEILSGIDQSISRLESIDATLATRVKNAVIESYGEASAFNETRLKNQAIAAASGFAHELNQASKIMEERVTHCTLRLNSVVGNIQRNYLFLYLLLMLYCVAGGLIGGYAALSLFR